MSEKLSVKLADLSVVAKKAEDQISAAELKTSRELAELRDAARSDAQNRISDISSKA